MRTLPTLPLGPRRWARAAPKLNKTDAARLRCRDRVRPASVPRSRVRYRDRDHARLACTLNHWSKMDHVRVVFGTLPPNSLAIPHSKQTQQSQLPLSPIQGKEFTRRSPFLELSPFLFIPLVLTLLSLTLSPSLSLSLPPSLWLAPDVRVDSVLIAFRSVFEDLEGLCVFCLVSRAVYSRPSVPNPGALLPSLCRRTILIKRGARSNCRPFHKESILLITLAVPSLQRPRFPSRRSQASIRPACPRPHTSSIPIASTPSRGARGATGMTGTCPLAAQTSRPPSA